METSVALKANEHMTAGLALEVQADLALARGDVRACYDLQMQAEEEFCQIA